uniref:Uncharacterized protein n=1 Tax=Anguilla anguilla TaxID=7936 RepID=A0A0E9VHY7_ANGAN
MCNLSDGYAFDGYGSLCFLMGTLFACFQYTFCCVCLLMGMLSGGYAF